MCGLVDLQLSNRFMQVKLSFTIKIPVIIANKINAIFYSFIVFWSQNSPLRDINHFVTVVPHIRFVNAYNKSVMVTASSMLIRR